MRVVAGALGGRVLAAPRGAETRPTSERVREALFAVLGELEGARVLDLFAGTGALALEALSRGAASAILVERARPALEAIRSNVRALDVADRARVIAAPVERSLAAVRRHAPFDLVLCDPPWGAAAAVEATLARWPWPELLAPSGRLALEHAASAPPSLASPELAAAWTRAWGDTAFTVYRLRHGG